MHVIALSYARNVLLEGSRERLRMERYAAHLDSLTLIVFSREIHNTKKEVHSGNFSAYATYSKSRVHMLFDAYALGKKILTHKKEGEEWIVTSQDPFETSIIGKLLARKYRVRHQVQIHGSFFDGTFWKHESVLNFVRYFIGRAVVRHAPCIRVVSERIKRSLVQLGVKERRIVVLPIRIDLENFLKHPIQERRKHTKEDDLVVLFVGRLSPEKNIPLIIQAVVQLQKDMPHTRLRIVGSGKEHTALSLYIESVHAADFVEIVPWTNDVEKEMGSADIFALASNHEGYGLVLVEAMAVGLPVVTTDVGCAGELLKHEIHGLIVPIGDSEAFTGALRTLATDAQKRRFYGEYGRQTAKELATHSLVEYEREWVRSFRCPDETV